MTGRFSFLFFVEFFLDFPYRVKGRIMKSQRDFGVLRAGSWSEMERALSVGALAEEGQEREVFLAQLALEGDTKILGQWYAWRKPDGIDALSPAERLLYMQVERDEVERAIDRALEAGGARGARAKVNSPTAALDRMLSESVAQDLARLYIPWSNPALVSMLDGRPNARGAAAWLLAWADDDALVEWLEACEDEQHALEAARMAGLLGNTLYWDAIVAWCELAESEGDEQVKAGFHAALACMDPVRYARGVVLGEMEADWILDSPLVADFLQTHGMTDWLETLALFEEAAVGEGVADDGEGDSDSRKAFEFAALVALGASAGVQEESGADGEQLFRWLEVARNESAAHAAEKLSASGSFGFQIALGEDDDLVVLLCEAAIHERLLELGEGSPGISGLPLSATDLEWVDLESARALFAAFEGAKQDDAVVGEALVALVHTLVDLRGWSVREPAEFSDLVDQAVAQFADSSNTAVRKACERLKGDVDVVVEDLKAQSVREDIVGLDSLRQLLVRGDIETLFELWLEGPLTRTAAVWGALGGDVHDGH